MKIHIRIHVQQGLKGLILVLGLVLIIGCGGVPPKRVYQPNPPGQVGQAMPLKIAVVELEDHSPGTGFNTLQKLAPPPGSLYSTEFQKYHHTLFGRCVAAELKESQLFQAVDYHPTWEKIAQDFRSYDAIVTGRLQHDRFEETMYIYGLPPWLWLLGVPVEHDTREAAFEVTAFKPHEPDRSLWTHSIRFRDSHLRGLLYGHGENDMRSMSFLARGSNLSDTDYCPTELLQPLFLAMRNNLAGALKQHNAGQANAPLAGAKSGEGKAP